MKRIPFRSRSFPDRRGQRGNTLLVVLILLLIMTLLGLASLRGAMLEERMTGNQFDRSLVFQAVEAALREGEEVAMALPAPPKRIPESPTYGCENGVCSRSSTYEGDQARFRFNAMAVQAKPLPNNTLAVPKPGYVRYLVVHWGTAETTYGCRQVLDANGQIKDPFCLADIYHVEARYLVTGTAAEVASRTSVSLRSVVHVPVLSSPSP